MVTASTDHFVLQKEYKVINIKLANPIIIGILSISMPDIHLPLFHFFLADYCNITELVILGIPDLFVQSGIGVVPFTMESF